MHATQLAEKALSQGGWGFSPSVSYAFSIAVLAPEESY